jgi:aminoglycoside phosphotransferase (APT) family kinase protein
MPSVISVLTFQKVMQERFHREITKIIEKEFGCMPGRITRMSRGICNDVYLVETDDREVIVRLKAEPRYMFGSHNHIPLFRSKGIRVPEILAEDYEKNFVPLAYQVLSKIEGRDIMNVIDTLTDEQLKGIAKNISNVFSQLKDVSNNGRFGVLWGDGDDLVDSWTAEIARMTKVVIGWGEKTGVIDTMLTGILEWINAEYKPYFDSVAPVTYFGDICAKNVMIDNGRFSGLVDLDSLAQGDPLEAIGRIKASWHGTHYGSVYCEAVMDEQKLDAKQRRIVSMYALLNRTYWTLENGVQFNQNTSPQVDRAREQNDRAIVQALYQELRSATI